MVRAFLDKTKVTPIPLSSKWLKMEVVARLGIRTRIAVARRRQLSSTPTPQGFLQATPIHHPLCLTTILFALCLSSPLPRIRTGLEIYLEYFMGETLPNLILYFHTWSCVCLIIKQRSLAEQHKMRSQLAAQLMPFFRLIARILTFHDIKYRNLTFRGKKYRILTFKTKQSCI